LIIVTAWRNSSKNYGSRGVCYGIRIPKKYYYALKQWEKIKLDGFDKSILRKIKTPFTEKCPEIRSKILGDYFNEKKVLLGWKKGCPPSLELHLTKNPNVWLLKKIKNTE